MYIEVLVRNLRGLKVVWLLIDLVILFLKRRVGILKCVIDQHFLVDQTNREQLVLDHLISKVSTVEENNWLLPKPTKV